MFQADVRLMDELSAVICDQYSNYLEVRIQESE